MRAILIDAYNKKLEEVDLPSDVKDFQTEIRILLRADTVGISHSNELLTVIFNSAAFCTGAPAFWSTLMEGWPLYGNYICVGRNPISLKMEDLYELYDFSNFKVRWCDAETTEQYRKTVIDFARTNKK